MHVHWSHAAGVLRRAILCEGTVCAVFSCLVTACHFNVNVVSCHCAPWLAMLWYPMSDGVLRCAMYVMMRQNL